jgi:ABC-type dipeptide/oligopeptide/nickel transport system permease subunit
VSIALWLIVAIAAYLALALLVGSALGLILGRISGAWEAVMTDALAVLPPRPDLAQVEELAIEEEALAGRNR